MEAIKRTNEHFHIFAMYEMEGNKMINTNLVYVPLEFEKAVKGRASRDEFIEVEGDSWLDRMRFMKVVAETVEELTNLLNEEEQLLLEQFNNQYKGAVS